MVCAKVVCERGRVTKLCGKDGVWQSGVWKMVWRKMVCDKVVLKMVWWKIVWWKMVRDKVLCERWCEKMVCDDVWKMACDKVVCGRWCVKDGVWQSGVWQSGVSKMVCDKMVCERWCVTMWCVKDGVWQCDVCHSTMSATPATQNDGGCEFVPRLPRETKVDVTKCHACHAKCRGVTGDKSGPSAPPSTICPTPATQNDGGCEFCATPATWNEGGCHQVPRLPRKVPRRHRRQIRTKRATQRHLSYACHTKRRWMRVLCHACHVKRRWMSPSATAATQSAAASHGDKAGPSAPPSAICPTSATQNDGGCELCATPATWNNGGCHQVPRRGAATQYHECHACHAKRRWMRVLCHACHVKRRWMSPSATPATQSAAASQATNPDQAHHPVPWLPRLPRKTNVDASFVPRLPH